MLGLLVPKRLEESAYGIDYEKEYESGIRGLVFDIDNTLVPHGAPADEKAVRLFQRLHALGFRTLLLSNNGEARVKPFAEACESAYLFKAGKPSRKAAEAALKLLGTKKEETLVIGDQLLTDLLTASRAGIPHAIVRPIDRKEPFQIVLKRILERPFLAYARRNEKIRRAT